MHAGCIAKKVMRGPWCGNRLIAGSLDTCPAAKGTQGDLAAVQRVCKLQHRDTCPQCAKVASDCALQRVSSQQVH